MRALSDTPTSNETKFARVCLDGTLSFQLLSRPEVAFLIKTFGARNFAVLWARSGHFARCTQFTCPG